MPIHDEDDDGEADHEDFDEQTSSRSSVAYSRSSPPGNDTEGDNRSPRDSTDSQNVLVESETSPDSTPYRLPLSSSAAALSHASTTLTSDVDESTSPLVSDMHARSPVPMQEISSPTSAEFTDIEERCVPNDVVGKDPTSPSAWDRLKNTFTRSSSSIGRRSRSNSVAARERRDNTDSSVSRESQGSMGSAKQDKESMGMFTVQQAQQPHLYAPPLVPAHQHQLPQSQTGSANASYVSLAATPGTRGGVSPVPPSSPHDLSRYQNSKLFPFPGLHKLEEERIRKGVSTPDPNTPSAATYGSLPDEYPYQQPTSPTPYDGTPVPPSPFMPQDRTLSRQASENALNVKAGAMPPPLNGPGPTYIPDYIDVGGPPSPAITTPTGSSVKLPRTVEGVKNWMKSFSGPSNTTGKKPSLSDLLRKKDTEEWDTSMSERSERSERSATTTTTSGTNGTVKLSQQRSQSPAPAAFDWSTGDPHAMLSTMGVPNPLPSPRPQSPDTVTPTKATPVLHPLNVGNGTRQFVSDGLTDNEMPSPPDPSLTTPDPGSSLSDYPSHDTSDASSAKSSSNSSLPANKGTFILERLDDHLNKGTRNPMWSSVIDVPPRKFLMSSAILQVVSPNIVKDRFLFLFSDILVIAKPVMQDDDLKLPREERKFTVKSVVPLHQLRFSGERAENQPRSPSTIPKNPIVRSFIQQFNRNPDQGITSIIKQTGGQDDPVFIGQLLFKSVELDRVQLGDYLSRRTSRLVLKSYLDCFGFIGVRIDRALRAFLLSIHLPPNGTSLDYLLDAFSGRWYEANAGIVAYDRDLATRVVRTIVQLNDLLHGSISQEAGRTDWPKRNIPCRDFVEAFRRYDIRNLVLDELLEEIYEDISHEKLFHAKASSPATDILITIKKALPVRLTYKLQSEPIIIRIPQPDPNFSIQLAGQDLAFEPPVLHFQRSPEASFRVIGTSLGVKKVLMTRSGPNAVKYSGLPISHSVTIERAFMRNTFQIAFANHAGIKRRYMFSLDDPLMCHQWAQSLKRQIDIASANTPANLADVPPGPARFHRAVEIVALKALQQNLIGGDGMMSVDKALRQFKNSGKNASSGLSHSDLSSRANGWTAPLHVRSKSRSRVYREGAGKNELDLNPSFNGHDSLKGFDESDTNRTDVPVWTGRDLELQCLQNSAIGAVLSFLQVGAANGS
jgi:serine/arginine repetitive matrix protein 2